VLLAGHLADPFPGRYEERQEITQLLPGAKLLQLAAADMLQLSEGSGAQGCKGEQPTIVACKEHEEPKALQTFCATPP